MTNKQPGTGMENTTARTVPPHRACHTVPTDIVASRASEILTEIFTPFSDWYAFLIFDDGSVAMYGKIPTSPPPPPEVSHAIVDIGRRLNLELHGPGYWMIAWHPQQRMSLIFADRDGTPKFTVDIDEPWARVRRWPITDFLDRAASAMTKYVEMRTGMGIPLSLDTLRPADLTQRPWFSGSNWRN